MKNYNLFLPVFKQGDYLDSHLRANNNDPVKSFLALAEQYKSAAEICEIVAKTLSSSKKIEVSGCTYSIYISVSKKIADPLVKNGILDEDNYCDE